MIRQTKSGVRAKRRGTVIPMVAVSLVALIGFLAMSFDLGRVAVIRTQLQNAADSAALAGAMALGTDNLVMSNFNQSNDIIAANSQAQTFAQANGYDLNDTRSVVLNTTTDVTVGILPPPCNVTQTMMTSGTTPLNSVRVNTFVDSAHGGQLQFLFAPVLGLNSTAITASATATVQLYAIASMKAVPNRNSPILPITMSKTDWLQMVNPTNNTLPDNYMWNSTTGQMVAGSDGLHEQQLYPGSNVSSSNNGLIQFGTGSHSNSVLQGEIVNGPTYDQMIAQWPPNGSPPWNAQNQFQISADPGWRTTTFGDLSAVAASGDVRLIPLNDGTNPGNGGNGSYTIVAFAPVRIAFSSSGGKSSGYALVQSAVLANDPTVIPSTTILAGTGQGGVPVARLTH